ncbi:hypothetical protein EBU71_14480, partial [bacterium]|nr:hypothetical protein [Candidatus Elulimicrobium humile]
MAFIKNSTIIINNNTNIFHTSYDSVSANIASTETKITAASPATYDYFGRSVAVGNGKIVIGASGTGAAMDGKVEIFNSRILSRIVTITAPTANSENFGHSVAVGDGHILIGDNEDSTNGFVNGKVSVYDLNGTVKPYATARFTALNPSFSYADFGSSVSIGSGVIVVGIIYGEDGNDIEIGSIEINSYDPTQITNVKYIINPDAVDQDFFGRSVSVRDGIVVVGAPGGEKTFLYDTKGNYLKKLTPTDLTFGDYYGQSVSVGCGVIAVGSPYNDDDGSDSGSVYLYDYSGSLITKIRPSDGSANKYFGYSVSVGSGRLLIGAHGDNSLKGSAYLYDLDGTYITKLTPSTIYSPRYGWSVSINEGVIAIGAPYDVISSQTEAGSVYTYKLPEKPEYFRKAPKSVDQMNFIELTEEIKERKAKAKGYYDLEVERQTIG